MKYVTIFVLITTCSFGAFAQDIKDMNWSQLQSNCVQEIESGKWSKLQKPKVQDFKILAWYRKKDERPIYVDSALCWSMISTKKGPKWVLAEMGRNPMLQEHPFNQAWHSAAISDRQNFFFIYFDNPPTNKDINQMDFWGSFKIRDWTIYDSKIMETNWQSAIGEKPGSDFYSILQAKK